MDLRQGLYLHRQQHRKASPRTSTAAVPISPTMYAMGGSGGTRKQ